MTKKIMFDSFRPRSFHRSRETPSDPDPNEHPLSQIKFYLDRYKIKEALSVFFDEETLNSLRNESDLIWDLIPIICKRLRGLCQYRFRVFEGCEKILCRIASDENCNPKEVLIVLLAEISQRHGEKFDDDNVFRAMIRPLELVLLRLDRPSPRNENLKWVINVLTNYIDNTEVPEETTMDNMKRSQLVNHPRVKRFVQILPSMLTLIDEFSEWPSHLDRMPMPILNDDEGVDEGDGHDDRDHDHGHEDYHNCKHKQSWQVSQFNDEKKLSDLFNGELLDDVATHNSSNTNDIDQLPKCDNSIEACAQALISLMFRPLAILDLTYDRPDLRIIANRCLLTLLKLRPNLFSPIYKLINEASVKTTNLEQFPVMDQKENVALAVCSFVYRCERLPIIKDEQYFPRIITHEFIFRIHTPYVVSLLRCSQSLSQEKGLILLEDLLVTFEMHSFGFAYLRFFESSLLKDYLLHVMVYSNLGTNRRKAHNLFVLICDLLDYQSKVELLTTTLSKKNLRPSLRATCIDQYRKHLTELYRLMIKTDSQINENESPSSSSFIEPPPESSRVHQVMDEGVFRSESRYEQADRIRKEKSQQSMESQDLQAIYKLIGGQSLVNFIKLSIEASLPEATRSDVIENYELILATLTLLRFLKLRKTCPQNQSPEETHFLESMNLKELFFEPVRKGLNITCNELKIHIQDNQTKREHLTQNTNMKGTTDEEKNTTHNEEMETINNGCEQEQQQQSKVDVDPDNDSSDNKCSNGHENSKRKDLDDVGCLEWLLCRLDLMASVLVQTCDLYNI